MQPRNYLKIPRGASRGQKALIRCATGFGAFERITWRLSVGAVALWLAGCGSNVAVEADFPTPVLVPAPLDVGLHLNNDFQNYVHSEKLSATWTVSLGTAQTELFSELMTAMFESVVPLADIQAQPSLDALIAAEIEDYAFSIPRDNGTDFYEVSIRYRISVYQADGALLDSWPVTGYGRSRSGLLPNAKDAVEEASILAMRDVAAILAVGMAARPTVQGLLQQKSSGNG